MLKDKMGMKGHLVIRLYDKNMKLIEEDHVDNLIVTVGKAHIIDQMVNAVQASMAYMAIGSGSVGAVVGDTALGTEINRKVFDSKIQGTAPNDNQVTYITTWGAGAGTGAISEAGIFNAASGQYMLNRTTFAVKNKGATDTLVITWIITIP